MGVYDSVYFECSCGVSMESQTRGGDVCCGRLPSDAVPLEAVHEILDYPILKCKNCGKLWLIAIKTVCLEAIEIEKLFSGPR